MGNPLLITALSYFEASEDPTLSHSIGQILLAAADEDLDTFQNLLQDVGGWVPRKTIYCNPKDEILAYSQYVHGYPRAGAMNDEAAKKFNQALGEVVPTLPRIVTLESGDNTFWGHFYYLNEPKVYYDMAKVTIYKNPNIMLISISL